jgi:hypothetical protein
MEGKITDEVVARVRQVLDSPSLQAAWARENFEIGHRHFSTEIARRRLGSIIAELRARLATLAADH